MTGDPPQQTLRGTLLLSARTSKAHLLDGCDRDDEEQRETTRHWTRGRINDQLQRREGGGVTSRNAFRGSRWTVGPGHLLRPL